MDRHDHIILRCSAVVFRGRAVLLVHRTCADADDWVLPGGTPQEGESTLSCARRETLEETGLAIEPERVAFVFETLGPDEQQRTVDLVFTTRGSPDERRLAAREKGLHPQFVAFTQLPALDLRPPLAGHLPALLDHNGRRCAPYLGNLWRPTAVQDATAPTAHPVERLAHLLRSE